MVALIAGKIAGIRRRRCMTYLMGANGKTETPLRMNAIFLFWVLVSIIFQSHVAISKFFVVKSIIYKTFIFVCLCGYLSVAKICEKF